MKNLHKLSSQSAKSARADASAPLPEARPARRARCAFDLWQDHARRSFPGTGGADPEEPDTVRLLKARRLQPSREFARRLSQFLASRGTASPRT